MDDARSGRAQNGGGVRQGETTMQRRKFLLGVGSTAVAGSALIGSGAFSEVRAQRSVTIQVAEDPNAYLGMDKCRYMGGETPNSSYAHLDGDGHLEIFMNEENPTIPNSDLGDGINSDSTSWFDNVFQICNQGKQAVCVYIEDDDWPTVESGDDVPSDAVGKRQVDFYYMDEDGRSIVGEDNKLTLTVGECVCIGIKTRSYNLSEGDFALDALGNEITIIATDSCLEDPQCAETEEIYLTNSSPTENGNEIDGTELLTVDTLDDNAGEANLTSQQIVNGGTFNQVDSLAATPDGNYLYFYDKTSGHLGRLDTSDLSGNSITDLGEVTNPSGSAPDQVVLGAFSPDGTLYVVGQQDDTLWTIDPNVGSNDDPKATEVGGTVDASGSDIVFDADTLYLHSNAAENDFHEIDPSNGDSQGSCDVGEDLTGLAIRDGGIGDILGSVAEYPSGPSAGEIIKFDRDRCDINQRYDMKLDGEDYLYESGDMATGSRCVFEGGFGEN